MDCIGDKSSCQWFCGGVVMGIVSATSFSRTGISDWILQRVTAVIVGAYFLFLAGVFVVNSPVSYDLWSYLFSCNVVRIFTLLALISLLIHGWIGWFA